MLLLLVFILSPKSCNKSNLEDIIADIGEDCDVLFGVQVSGHLYKAPDALKLREYWVNWVWGRILALRCSKIRSPRSQQARLASSSISRRKGGVRLRVQLCKIIVYWLSHFLPPLIVSCCEPKWEGKPFCLPFCLRPYYNDFGAVGLAWMPYRIFLYEL